MTDISKDDFDRMWHAVFGNGHPGLDEDVRTIKRALFHNKQTGESGLVADVAEIKRLVLQARTAWWLVGVAVALLEALRAFGVIGGT